MNTKYIFVTGGVVSGLGKGITAASLGRLLKNRGYKVTIQKFDPYINVDPGTMNPYEHGEVFVYGMHISPYEKGNIFNKDPLRTRKLLLHQYEIRKIAAKIAEKGFTLVPLKVYFKGSLVKVEIGIAKGKKLYDKRQTIAKNDQRREAEREFKVKNLY